MKQKKNILITGARGFIGKNLVEHLNRTPDQYSLFYPYHKELELLDEGKVEGFIGHNKIDTIIHCASIGGSRKTGYDTGKTDIVSTNLRMFFNLAKNLDKVERMIYFGSGAEYDRRHYKPKMMEDFFGTHIPADDYGFSKYVCTKFAESHKKIVNLRVFGMFGKYEDHEFKFISNAIVKNLLKLPIIINQNVKFDYMYINDAVRIIEDFISNKPRYNVYNLTTGKTIDLISIARTINDISDFKSEVIVNNPGLNVEYSGDNARLLKEIRCEYTPLTKAIAELFMHYKGIIHQIDSNKIANDEYIKNCIINKDACKDQ